MAISRPCYATREAVKRALDYKQTARSDGQVDRAIEAASDGIDGGTHRIGGLLKRRFYPEQRTMTFDWPGTQYAQPWRLWLDQHEVISVTTLTAAGVAITAGDYFLRPDDGPPFNRVEINIGTNAAFNAGNTRQRAIAITGLFGFCSDTATAGALAEALDDSETGVDVADSAAVGVGDVLLVDSERMLVTDKAMLDTGVNIDAADSLTASNADVSITMSTTTSAPAVDEVILIDSERMLVVDVAGSVLTVKRAWDGSVLAAHSANADIYAPRTLTVTRGALGSTAATHSSSTAVSRYVVPGLVRDLAVAEAIDQLLQETSGYARAGAVQDNTHSGISVSNIRSSKDQIGLGIDAIRARAYTAYGRKARVRAV